MKVKYFKIRVCTVEGDIFEFKATDSQSSNEMLAIKTIKGDIIRFILRNVVCFTVEHGWYEEDVNEHRDSVLQGDTAEVDSEEGLHLQESQEVHDQWD